MRIAVERLLGAASARRAQLHRSLALEGTRISAVAAAESGAGEGLLAMPAPANAHDHARAVKPAALGALELPLELWLAADGRVAGVDLPALEREMIAQLRRGMREFGEWQRAVVRMRAALTRFYATGMHCS